VNAARSSFVVRRSSFVVGIGIGGDSAVMPQFSPLAFYESLI